MIISSLRPELSSGGMVHHAQQIETTAVWQKCGKMVDAEAVLPSLRVAFTRNAAMT